MTWPSVAARGCRLLSVSFEALVFGHEIERELKRGLILERAMEVVRRRDPRRWGSRRKMFGLWSRCHRDRFAAQEHRPWWNRYEMVERMLEDDPGAALNDPDLGELAYQRMCDKAELMLETNPGAALNDPDLGPLARQLMMEAGSIGSPGIV